MGCIGFVGFVGFIGFIGRIALGFRAEDSKEPLACEERG